MYCWCRFDLAPLSIEWQNRLWIIVAVWPFRPLIQVIQLSMRAEWPVAVPCLYLIISFFQKSNLGKSFLLLGKSHPRDGGKGDLDEPEAVIPPDAFLLWCIPSGIRTASTWLAMRCFSCFQLLATFNFSYSARGRQGYPGCCRVFLLACRQRRVKKVDRLQCPFYGVIENTSWVEAASLFCWTAFDVNSCSS